MKGWSEQVRRLKQLLRRRGQSKEDAEDLVQEAFLRLHAFLQEGGEVQMPQAFLTRAALNLAVDARRRDRRDRREQFVADAVEDLPLIDIGPSPEEVLSAETRLVQIRRVLDEQVGERTREIFLLHRIEGFTHEEIAARMNMSVRTVEKHIARAVTAVWMDRNTSEGSGE